MSSSGSQTQIALRAKLGLVLVGPLFDYLSVTLWCWRNNSSTWTFTRVETALPSFFLWKLLWVVGKSFSAISMFV